MKRKTDFVTNSSSSSFVAWGIEIDLDTLLDSHGIDIYKIILFNDDKRRAEKAAQNGAFMTIKSNMSDEEVKERFERWREEGDTTWDVISALESIGLEASSMYYDSDIMVGVSPFNIGDDQTKRQFKEEICQKFKKFGYNIKPEQLTQIEEAWMDN